MNSKEIDLVTTTWRQVAPAADQVAETFYTKLFELEPEYRSMFSSDMKRQGRQLMTMIGFAVSSLTRLESIVPTVQDLAKRHVSYGVKHKDYEVVGQALLWTLKKGLGQDFTPEVEQAWTDTYNTLASVMINATTDVAQSA